MSLGELEATCPSGLPRCQSLRPTIGPQMQCVQVAGHSGAHGWGSAEWRDELLTPDAVDLAAHGIKGDFAEVLASYVQQQVDLRCDAVKAKIRTWVGHCDMTTNEFASCNATLDAVRIAKP